MPTACPNLASLFYASAILSPQSQAMTWEGGFMTYAQMLDSVEKIRSAIRPQSGSFIGILAHRSPLAFMAVQAILAEGNTYVPLNPNFPASRNAFILSKANLTTLVVGEECAGALAALLREVAQPILIIADPSAHQVKALALAHPERISFVALDLAVNKPIAPLIEPVGEGLAYVLFTSGSTGEPKGVCVKHENVFSYLNSFLQIYPIRSEDRLSQTFDLTFDLSVHDQFLTWASGATLVLFSEKNLASPLVHSSKMRVTVWFSVPSLPAFLEAARLAIPEALPGLRLSLFCGEKLTWKVFEIWKGIAPNSRIVNTYGPTETTIAITHFEIPTDFLEMNAYKGGIPIGRAFPGQGIEVRNPDGSPCPTGETGALWLTGDQITNGYLNEAIKTAERFVARDNLTWYRTGDLVMRDTDGVLHFLAREDFQVKIMGYRIELEEIEHVLMRCSGAPMVIAEVAKIRGSMEELYCVLPKAYSARKKELKLSMKKLLPAYMAPRHMYFTDDFPLNANGKMDRGALNDLVIRGELSV
jgi:amino acid adenylation domain-containing protein